MAKQLPVLGSGRKLKCNQGEGSQGWAGLGGVGTRSVPMGCSSFLERTSLAQGPYWRSLPPSCHETPRQNLGGSAGASWGQLQGNPVSPRDQHFSSRSHRSLWRVIFSSLISLRPTFLLHFIPFSVFLFVISLLRAAFSCRAPSAFPALQPLRDEGRGLGAGLAEAEPGCQQGRVPGEGFWEALPISPKGLRRGQAGGAGNPLAAPQRAGAPRRAAVLQQFCQAAASRGEGGSRNPKSAADSLHPSPGAIPDYDKGICPVPKPPA